MPEAAMGDVFDKLQQMRLHKKVTWKVLAKAVDQTEGGLVKSLQNRTLTVENMIKICRTMGEDPATLFQNEFEGLSLAEPAPTVHGFKSRAVAQINECRKILGALEGNIQALDLAKN